MAFQPGESGNPGGRPKENARIKALARTYGEKAVAKIAALLDSADEKMQLAAAQALLDRGFGKPAQAIVGGDDDDNPIKAQLEGFIRLKRPTDSGGGQTE